MDGETLRSEIEDRDDRISQIDSFLPKTLESLIDHQIVTLKSGPVYREEWVEIPADSWSYTRTGELIIRFNDQYFKLDVRFDSWDEYAWCLRGSINEVRKVPVQRMTWEEI